MNISNYTWRIWTLILSVGIFIISLTQKCYCTSGSCGDSLAVFLSGTIGFLLGGAALTWIANPLIIISWLTINKNYRASLFTSLAALLISISFLLFDVIVSDEAGNYSKIVSYKIGYWLWLSSMAVMFVGNTIIFLKK